MWMMLSDCTTDFAGHEGESEVKRWLCEVVFSD